MILFEGWKLSLLALFSTAIVIGPVIGDTKNPQRTKTTDNAICTSQETCANCVRTQDCVWCGEKRNLSDHQVSTIPRCIERGSITRMGKGWCKTEKIVNPVSGTVILRNGSFSSEKGRQVQVAPQGVKIQLRPGDTEKLTVRYKQANDYPVDLYFLMDLSASMESHRDTLSSLGVKLAEVMTNLTSNFHLGFGSFIDKVVLPMTSSQEKWSKGTCQLSNGVPCAAPYGYKNQMPLTVNSKEFKSSVMSAPISGNVDSPEGGLDALMQTMVCWKEIGWRDQARHLLVFSSDAKYHIAGDGRLAGIIEPNDEQCHLDKEGFYTHAELLDYPSLSQIKKNALKSGIHIIFAVTGEVLGDYKSLSDYLTTSSIGKLDRNSENVVDLVRDEYKKLVKEVKMTHNEMKEIEISTYTDCAGSSPYLRESSECANSRVNVTLEFEYRIKAVGCPKDPKDWRKKIEIKPQGVNESVIVDVELMCDCPCSKPDHEDYAKNSTECSSHGDLTCGVCSCEEKYFGKQCLCRDDRTTETTADSKEACRANNSTNEECNGRGRCVCGACICNPRSNPDELYYGKFCQCDNFSCDRSSDMVCGGPESGRCECGVCKCNAGLTGRACDCSSSKASCLPPGENTLECSGYGHCECGECICNVTEGRSGKYCEKCPTCPDQHCDELKDCVECMVHRSGEEFDKDPECRECESIIDLADTVDTINETTVFDDAEHICTVPDAARCTFVFSYREPRRGDTAVSKSVVAENDKKCPLPPVSPFGVAGTAIGLTLILGLLGLLAWKLLTTIHDQREFAKFEKERVRATYQGGTNPIFKAPTSTFNNPMFETQQNTK